MKTLALSSRSLNHKMRSVLLATVFTCCALTTFSQETEYDKIAVKTPEECKLAEPKVLEAANLTLDKPLRVKDNAILKARSLVVAWMSNTSDYTFSINEKILKLTKSNELLFGLYMACMAKYALEHPDKAKNETQLQMGSYTILADYIEKKENGVEITKPIEKFLAARKAGKLEEYIGK